LRGLILPAKKTFYNLPEEKQKKIIDVAVKEFAGQGYQQASINNIIAHLGIAKGSMYQYFDNKENLFLFIFEYGIHLVKDSIRQAENNTQPDYDVFTKIRLFFSSSIEFVKKYPLIFRLYLRTLFENGVPFKQEIIKKIHITSIEYLIPILEEGKRRGEIRWDCNTQLIAFMLDASIDRLLQSYLGSHCESSLIFAQAPDNLEKDAAKLIEMVKRGIAA